MLELLSVCLFAASITLYACKAGRNIGWFLAMLFAATLFIVLNVTLFISNYFTGEGINDAVLYTLTNSLTGAGVEKYILPGIGVTLALILFFSALTWFLRRKNRPHHFGYSLLAIILAGLSVYVTPAFQQVTYLLASQRPGGDSDFADYYTVPEELIANPKMNLVYIYGESLERTYFDEEHFPDLTPELNQVRQQATDFSHTTQLPGMDYTIAGMVASQCGIPLFAPFEGNSSAAMSSFFPKNICLGDILKASGYKNYFIQGADLRFAGKDIFLSSHGFDYLYGAQELKGQLSDPNYRNNWGFYDDTVLDEVYQQFMTLSAAGERFSLFALTVDTHHPDGFISKTCQRRSYRFDGKENKTLSAVTCSQEHIAALIEKIKASPYFKQTIIVVSSDHLAMNNTAYKYLTRQDRNNLFFIIRGDKPDSETIALKRNPMDNGATVLDMLGGGNEIGLGRSSLSLPSLSEIFDDMKDKIMSWKPDIIDLWQFPKHISEYRIDQNKGTFSYSGAQFRLPLLLKVANNKVEPLPESEYSAPLRYQLADFKKNDKFIWVDRCFKMARLWAPQLALNPGLCVAEGQLDGEPKVRHITDMLDIAPVSLNESETTGQFEKNVAALRVEDNDIRYDADAFIFSLPGAPQSVKQYSGLSRAEAWGRWSNANLAPHVTIEFKQPLPRHFTLTLTGKAYGTNNGKPTLVQVGDRQQSIVFTDQMSTASLTFDNPQDSTTITLIPPDPQLSNEGNIVGHDPRKLGIGLERMTITPAP